MRLVLLWKFFNRKYAILNFSELDALGFLRSRPNGKPHLTPTQCTNLLIHLPALKHQKMPSNFK